MKSNTFRLFISSTFSDFQLERELLNNDVYPIIYDFCRAKGYDFQLVDLRWGVNHESSYNHNTVEICLNEVKRCKDYSPRPNFLAMIGERYGWVPLPSDIEKKDFDIILQNANSNEKQLLHHWYVLDENSRTPIYCLKNRVGEYKDENKWAEEEDRIRSTLIKLLETSNIDRDIKEAFLSSATEKEILEGFLNDETPKNTLVYFRDGFKDKDDDLSRINNLRNRITDKLESLGNNNIIRMSYSSDDKYKEKYKESICNLLKGKIAAEIERLQKEKEKESFRDIVEDEFGIDRFIDSRRSVIEEFNNYINSESKSPLYVYGEPGSGKTTALAELLKEYNSDCYCAFYGLLDENYNLISSLGSIIESIKENYGIFKPLVLTRYNAAQAFFNALYSIPNDRRALVIIDGIEMFQDIDEIRENIIPDILPDNVKMIISSADQRTIERFSTQGAEKIIVNDIDENASFVAFSEIMKSRGRILNNSSHLELVKDAIKGGCSPLKIKLLADIASKWRSYDDVNEISSSVEDLAAEYLESMFRRYGHEKALCLNAYALINSSPYGIMENELQELLLTIDEVRIAFEQEDRYSYSHNRLPFVVWSRLFHDIGDSTCFHISQGKIVVKFKHSVFYNAVTAAYSDKCEAAEMTLSNYFMQQDNYVNDKDVPNYRKAFMLPDLLHRIKRDQELLEEYNNVDFIDILVKSKRLDYYITDIQSYYENRVINPQDYAYCVMNCMRDNYDLLRCYRDRLKQCLSEDDLYKEEFVINRQVFQKDPTIIQFPYSKTSQLYVTEDNSFIAVVLGEYVYLCTYPDFIEKSRAFIHCSDKDEKKGITDIKWVKGRGFVAVTETRVLLFGFNGTQTELIKEWEHSGKNVELDPKTNSLFFIREGTLYKVKLQSNEEFALAKARAFALGTEQNELYVFNDKYEIVGYNTQTLNTIESAPLKVKRSLSLRYRRKVFDRIAQIDHNNFILGFQDFGTILHYGKKEGSLQYLALPFPYFFTQPLFGNRYIIYYVEGILFFIDTKYDYEITYIKVPDGVSCFWAKKDEQVLVLTENGIKTFLVSDGKRLPDDASRIPLVKKVGGLAFEEWNIPGFLRLVYIERRFIHYNDYDVLFFKNIPDIRKPEKASIIEYANDGKYAIAYELNNAIVVFDANGNRLLKLDTLNLSVINNILKIQFSPDSSKLLLWRTYSIEIVDINKARCVKRINVRKRPVYDALFSDDSSQIDIILCNEHQYIYSLSKGKWIGDELPRYAEPVDPDYKDTPFGIYKAGRYSDDSYIPIRSFSSVWEEMPPTQWFNNYAVYANNEHTLFFIDGNIYDINGVNEIIVDNTFFDFDEGRYIERIKDQSESTGFLREKNDVMSNLYTLDSTHLLLVGRALRAIVLFNTKESVIESIHKMNADIIGDRINEEGNLEVFCNQFPYTTTFTINKDLLKR